MRSDSPPPSWFQPRDLINDEDTEHVVQDKPLTKVDGIVWWRRLDSDD